MLRYWYKLNGDLLNYGIGNELLSNTDVYGNTYPKMLYKNSYKCFSGTDVSDTDVAINLSEKLDIYSCSIWYYVDEFDSLDLYNNVSLICFYSNKTHIPNVSSTDIRHWRNYVITYDGTTYRSYVDGKQHEVNVADYKLLYKITLHTVGNWKGALCDIKIFDHVLSNKEIEELSTPLLVHLPFNYICIKSLNLTDNIPGLGYIDCTSTLTKDTVNYTGDIPDLDKEYIMNHLGEYIVASAYILSLGSYTKEKPNLLAYFGPELELIYIDNNDTRHTIYGSQILFVGAKKFCYACFKIPDDIKSVLKVLFPHESLKGGFARPDQYGVTWTFSHFKIEPGTYPSYPFRYYGFEDVTGHEYDGITQFMDACACINDSPRYQTGVRLYGSSGGVIGNIQLYNLKDNYGLMNIGIGFTMAIWFKINNMTGSGNTLIFSYYDDIDESGFILHANENAFFLNQHVHNSDTVIGTVVKPCNMNTWYHCVLSVNMVLFKLYINGELLNLSNNSSIIAAFTDNSIIGINRLHNTDISVSDFRMYKTVLSDLKIKDIYNEASSIDDNGDVFSRELIEYEYINLR